MVELIIFAIAIAFVTSHTSEEWKDIIDNIEE